MNFFLLSIWVKYCNWLHTYVTILYFVCRLDSDIEARLSLRLQAAIKSWTAALLGLDEEQEVAMDTEESKQSVQHKLGGDPKIMRTVHELRMQVRDVRSTCIFDFDNLRNQYFFF